MLLFIGGAARTGKSSLVQRLLHEKQLPFLSVDVLKMGLARGAPELQIDPDAGAIAVAERVWPLVYEMSQTLLYDRVDYVFEGELLPRHVAALRAVDPSQVYACFLGYAAIPVEQKLHEIRMHTTDPYAWPYEYTDEALQAVIVREIAFSQYLVGECERYHWPYFDSSTDFTQTLDQVVEYVNTI